MQRRQSNVGDVSGAEISNARSLSVRHMTRQLLTEYGEQAGAVARQRAELSLTEDEARRWRQVLDAVTSLSPGPAPGR